MISKTKAIAALEELKGDCTGQIAMTIEDCQKAIGEMVEENGWVPGKKPPKVWKDEKGDAINFLAVIPGVGVDIANWIEPTRCWFCMGVPCKVVCWMPLPEPPKEAQG